MGPQVEKTAVLPINQHAEIQTSSTTKKNQQHINVMISLKCHPNKSPDNQYEAILCIMCQPTHNYQIYAATATALGLSNKWLFTVTLLSVSKCLQ
jgi:hypothetical protein